MVRVRFRARRGVVGVYTGTRNCLSALREAVNSVASRRRRAGRRGRRGRQGGCASGLAQVVGRLPVKVEVVGQGRGAGTVSDTWRRVARFERAREGAAMVPVW